MMPVCSDLIIQHQTSRCKWSFRAEQFYRRRSVYYFHGSVSSLQSCCGFFRSLYIADCNNCRVLVLKSQASKANGAAADYELGQTDFNSSVSASTQSGIKLPAGMTFDTTNNVLLLSDSGNNRVLQFDEVNAPPTLTANANNPTFTEGGSAATLYSSTAITTVKTGQTILQVGLTVTNVTDGTNEILNIDGSSVALDKR